MAKAWRVEGDHLEEWCCLAGHSLGDHSWAEIGHSCHHSPAGAGSPGHHSAALACKG